MAIFAIKPGVRDAVEMAIRHGDRNAAAAPANEDGEEQRPIGVRRDVVFQIGYRERRRLMS